MKLDLNIHRIPTYLPWLDEHDVFCFLRSDQDSGRAFLAIGAAAEISGECSLKELDAWLRERKKPVFGYLNYDLKNRIEKLKSTNSSSIGFEDFFFFEPKALLYKSDSGTITLESEDKALAESIADHATRQSELSKQESIRLNAGLSKEEYIDSIKRIQQHIQRGDVYELNFCQEFTSSGKACDPYRLFSRLMQDNPTPFSSFLKLGDRYVIGASPERFMRRIGNRLFSEPMKGTVKRSSDPKEDETLKLQLAMSDKDRSENVMIVDLVRNDLSKVAAPGSVKVDELFGVYSFPKVHQMISTVSCKLRRDTSFSQIIEATFPMGSMTGAPKIRAMELIEEFEQFKRGLFSGSIGYIMPNGDFDLNVVIRTLFYDRKEKLLSVSAGGAITIKSEPEAEYEESLLKIEGIQNILNKP